MDPQYIRCYGAYEPPPRPAPQFSSQATPPASSIAYGVSSQDFFKAGEIAAKQEAEAAAVKEVLDRIAYESDLAVATGQMLDNTRRLVVCGASTVAPSTALARFRKELQPLAETYGLRIVLVGDRTTATLVK